MIDAQFLELVGSQYGVVARTQLSSVLGWSRQRVLRAHRTGVLRAATTNVFRLASSPETFHSRCMAIQLHFDGEAFLSAWTAARLYGLRKMPAAPIHITMPARLRRKLPPGVRSVRSAWMTEADWTTMSDGLSVARPMRMLFGLAAAFGQYRFERAAEDAWALGIITPLEAADYLEQHRCRGKDGVTTMHTWLDHALEQKRPAQTGLEQLVLECVERVGLPAPVRQFPLVLPSGELIHFDMAWPHICLAVEPGDSWWHGGAMRQRQDHARDRACGELGWHVIRFDESVRDDPMAAARQIRRIHAARSSRNVERA